MITAQGGEMLKNIFNRVGTWRDCLYLLIGYTILALMFQWASIHFGYKRHFYNAEMMMAFVLYAMGLRWLSVIAFLASIALEISLGLTTILYLFDLGQVLDVAGYTLETNKSYLIFLGLLAGVTIACFWLVSRSLKTVSWKKIVALGVALFSSQVAISSVDVFNPIFAERDNLLFGSSAKFTHDVLSLNAIRFRHISTGDAEYMPIQNPSAARLVLKKEALPERILFIVAESWGQPKRAEILEQQIRVLRSSDRLEFMELGKIHALGATAVGELRELCGIIPTHLNFRKMSSSSVGECLPADLKSKGYRTIAMHGAHGMMYRRLMWYPLVGFEDLIFREALPYSKEKMCHSFPGYCDREMLDVVSGKFDSSGKIFFYWLTLNSHTPYDERDVLNYRPELCDSVFEGGFASQLCNYQNLHVQFFEALSKLIERESMKGVEVVVVGDHPPLFKDESSRLAFQSEKVPLLHFKVK